LKDFLIKEALNNFDQNQINYCVFKSTDHLLAGLNGETDIDLLIEEEKINSALKALKELGFKITKPSFSVINPYRYGLVAFCQKAKKLVYLDIMTRFVVGINRVRQVRSLDIAKKYLRVAKPNEQNIYTLNPEEELECLFMRIIAKSANGIPFYDYLLANWLANYKFKKEITYLRKKAKIVSNRNFLNLKEYINLKRKLEKDSELNLIERHILHFLKELYAFLGKVFTYKYLNHLNFCFFRRRLKKSKIILICGVDGSGKSTLSKELTKSLKWKLDVKRLYLGAGDGEGFLIRRFGTFISKIIFKKTSQNRKFNYSNKDQNNFKNSLRIIWALIVAFEKLLKYFELKKLKFLGNIIILDRFPNLNKYGMNDAPLLKRFENSSNFLIRYLVNLEKLIYIFYSKEIKINLCLKLEASHKLVESRGEEMSKIFYKERKDSLNQALDTINIEKTIILNAEESILDLKSRALEEIINYKNKE